MHDEDDFTTIPGAMLPPTTLKRLLLLPSPRAKPGRPRGAQMQQRPPASALPVFNATGPQSTMPLAAATTSQEGKPCVIPAPPVALDPDARSAMRSAGDRYWARNGSRDKPLAVLQGVHSLRVAKSWAALIGTALMAAHHAALDAGVGTAAGKSIARVLTERDPGSPL